MVAPVSGPFQRNQNIVQSTVRIDDIKRWSRQVRPYTLALPYLREYGFTKKVSGSTPSQIDSTWRPLVTSFSSAPSVSFPKHLAAYNDSYAKAYDRFVSRMKAGNSASLGVSVAEVGESAKMIISRAQSLRESVVALRNRDPVSFFRALFGHKKPTHRDKKLIEGSKNLSNVYLEYVFGWRPLVEDIGNAVQVLSSDSYTGLVKSKSGKFDARDTNIFGYCESYYECEIRGKVSTSSPFLRTLNELGFVNPVQVAWDVIPFSYLVNWFVPVSKYLGSYTDFVGITMTDCHVTRHVQVLRSLSSVSYPYTSSFEGWAINRYSVSQPPVPGFSSLKLKLPGGDLMGKATSSVAVLVQQLKTLR